jgi:hypothetical protein
MSNRTLKKQINSDAATASPDAMITMITSGPVAGGDIDGFYTKTYSAPTGYKRTMKMEYI